MGIGSSPPKTGRRKSVDKALYIGMNNKKGGREHASWRRVSGSGSQYTVDGDQYHKVEEEVKPFHMSKGFVSDLKENSQPTSISNVLLLFLKVAVGALLSVIIIFLIFGSPNFNDPFVGIQSNWNFVLLCYPPGAFIVFYGLSSFVANVAGAPKPWYNHSACSLVGTFTHVGCIALSRLYLDIFPFPFATVTIASFSLVTFFISFYFQYPKKVSVNR